jgi:hypothetical protein
MRRTSSVERRWFPTNQPQTLQAAVGLLYWNAVLGLIVGIVAGGYGHLTLILIAAELIGGYGISNERKWGYYLALLSAVGPLIMVIVGFLGAGILYLLFQIALVVLLLHPQSREYFRIWYR